MSRLVGIFEMQTHAEKMRLIRELRQKKYDEALKPIIEELLSFGLGYNAIARALNARNIPSPNGGENTGQGVRRTITRLGLETTQ